MSEGSTERFSESKEGTPPNWSSENLFTGYFTPCQATITYVTRILFCCFIEH